MNVRQILILSVASCAMANLASAQDVAINPQYVQLESMGAGALDHGPTTPAPAVVDPKTELRRQESRHRQRCRTEACSTRTGAWRPPAFQVHSS